MTITLQMRQSPTVPGSWTRVGCTCSWTALRYA